MIVAKKNNYFLLSKTTINKKIYKIIIEKIPNSIFSKIDFFFFKKILENKIINLYIIKKKNNLSSIITTTSVKNYDLLKKKIIIYLLKKPIYVISNLFFFLSLLKRDSNIIYSRYNEKYLHLLHFIILKKSFVNKSIKFKDQTINFFFKKIIKINNANFFYLCYEKSNFKAHNYYKRNNFKIYKQNKLVTFVKKK